MPKTLPPFVSNFAKKINPHFFSSEIESMITNTNFTLGPIENSFSDAPASLEPTQVAQWVGHIARERNLGQI